MAAEPQCPKCQCEYTYADGAMWVCPQCAHEWSQHEEIKAEALQEEDNSIRDSNGNILSDGDSVVVIKDLPVKGAPKPIKSGTKVKNIRLRDMGDGHNISCKIDGFGDINLKSEFVRKA
jgi:protein PhnA